MALQRSPSALFSNAAQVWGNYENDRASINLNERKFARRNAEMDGQFVGDQLSELQFYMGQAQKENPDLTPEQAAEWVAEKQPQLFSAAMGNKRGIEGLEMMSSETPGQEHRKPAGWEVGPDGRMVMIVDNKKTGTTGPSTSTQDASPEGEVNMLSRGQALMRQMAGLSTFARRYGHNDGEFDADSALELSDQQRGEQSRRAAAGAQALGDQLRATADADRAAMAPAVEEPVAAGGGGGRGAVGNQYNEQATEKVLAGETQQSDAAVGAQLEQVTKRLAQVDRSLETLNSPQARSQREVQRRGLPDEEIAKLQAERDELVAAQEALAERMGVPLDQRGGPDSQNVEQDLGDIAGGAAAGAAAGIAANSPNGLAVRGAEAAYDRLSEGGANWRTINAAAKELGDGVASRFNQFWNAYGTDDEGDALEIATSQIQNEEARGPAREAYRDVMQDKRPLSEGEIKAAMRTYERTHAAGEPRTKQQMRALVRLQKAGIIAPAHVANYIDGNPLTGAQKARAGDWAVGSGGILYNKRTGQATRLGDPAKDKVANVKAAAAERGYMEDLAMDAWHRRNPRGGGKYASADTDAINHALMGVYTMSSGPIEDFLEQNGYTTPDGGRISLSELSPASRMNFFDMASEVVESQREKTGSWDFSGDDDTVMNLIMQSNGWRKFADSLR